MPAKKTAKKAPAKTTVKKVAAKKAVAKKPAVKKVAAKKPAVKKAVAKKPVTKKVTAAKRKRVTFSITTNPNCKIFVAGDFNNWDATDKPLKAKTAKGRVYSTTIMLPVGTYEYKFVIDGIWSADPECSEWAKNEMGTLNSVIKVG